MAAGGAAERARQRGQAAKTRWRGEIKPSQLGNAAGVQYGAQSSPVLRIKQGRSQNQELGSKSRLRTSSWVLSQARYTCHGMTDTELRSLSDTNLNAHGGPRAPRDPLLEKDKRLEKVRHLLLCRGSTGCRSWRKDWEGGR